MSHYWVIRCKDCDVQGQMEINRGLEDVRGVIRDRRAIVAIYKTALELGLLCDLTLGDRHVKLDREFLLEHQDHTLVAHDEYGRDDQ